MSEPRPSELDLHGVLRVLRRWLWLVILVPVVVTGATVGTAAAKTPRYRSSAEILVGRTQAETIFNPLAATFTDPSRVLNNQIRVILSQEVTERAHDRLGFAADIEARAATTEDVITLSAVGVNARRAAAIVDAYAAAYLDYRRESGESENRLAQDELRRQIGGAEARLDLLEAEVNRRPAAERAQIRANQADEREAIQAQLVEQRTQLANLEAAANVERGGAQLLAPADVPRRPFDPDLRRSGILGLSSGLLLGLGLAFLLDYLDNRIRGKEDLERATGDLPVVGMVPTLPGWRNRSTTHVASLEDSTSAAAEAYRALRTSIEFVGLDRSLRTLQITSPMTSEGKTTTLVNLAVALARAGKRVIAVDCDLRRPRVHAFFDLEPGVGFTSVLVGDAALSAALQPVPAVENLRVLTAGPIPPNPSELLSGARTIEILSTLQSDADIVLVDSPPVLPVSDAAALSTRVDATLIVVSANNTQRKQLARALELLHQVEAVVVGTVLNGTGRRRDSYDTYGYGYRPYVAKPARDRGANKATRAEPRHLAR